MHAASCVCSVCHVHSSLHAAIYIAHLDILAPPCSKANLLQPLADIAALELRYDAVEELLCQCELATNLQVRLSDSPQEN